MISLELNQLQKQLEALPDPVSFLTSLFAYAPVGFQIYRTDGYCLLTNKAFRDLFGSEPPPEYNVFEDEIVKAAGILELINRALAGETVQTPTIWYDARELKQVQVESGRRIAISATFFPVFSQDGQVNFIALVFKDETEAMLAQERLQAERDQLRQVVQQMERAEQELRQLKADLELRVAQRTSELAAANKELEAFSYSVSHDLRAPLRAIDGFSRILQEDYDSRPEATRQRYLGLIRNATQQMGQLIEDLLAFSRLGRQAINLQIVYPEALARQVLEELRGEQEGRQLEIILGQLPACQADPALLKQVFINLIGNALKFSRSRERSRIELGCHETPEETIWFVKDNGVGFDQRYAPRLFGVFQRLHPAEEYEGTGVGLALVQRIIQRHGGRIWAEAEPDKGATFYFTLGGEGSDPYTS
jgi:signal transduction histidine kinase